MRKEDIKLSTLRRHGLPGSGRPQVAGQITFFRGSPKCRYLRFACGEQGRKDVEPSKSVRRMSHAMQQVSERSRVVSSWSERPQVPSFPKELNDFRTQATKPKNEQGHKQR